MSKVVTIDPGKNKCGLVLADISEKKVYKAIILQSELLEDYVRELNCIEEISQIGDQIVLIKDGKKIDNGAVSDILNTNLFGDLTGKFELSSVLDGIVVSNDHNLHITTLDVDGQKLIVPGYPGKFNNEVRVRIRSRDILLSSSRLKLKITENELEGFISTIEIEKNSAFSELVILLKNKKNNKNSQKKLRARITTYNLKKIKLSRNDTVFIYISSVSIDRQAYQST